MAEDGVLKFQAVMTSALRRAADGRDRAEQTRVAIYNARRTLESSMERLSRAKTILARRPSQREGTP